MRPAAKAPAVPRFEHERGNSGELHHQVGTNADDGAHLTKDGAAQQWFMDAYGHCKTIGYCPATKEYILDQLGLELDDGVVPNAEFASLAPARHWDREPKVRMLA